MSGGAQAAGNTPDGQPPSNYPVCTSKGQDRCVQSGHMMAGSGMGKHHKMMGKHHRRSKHHMKAMTSKASGGSAPASAPASSTPAAPGA